MMRTLVPILREVLRTGRKIVTLSFTEEKLCVMFGSTNFHLLIPLHLQIKGIVVGIPKHATDHYNDEKVTRILFPRQHP